MKSSDYVLACKVELVIYIRTKNGASVHFYLVFGALI